MHKATCSECGANCEIPFRPTGERPVFCSNCFKNQSDDGGKTNKFGVKRRESSGFRGGRGDRGDRQMHDAVCAKCGKNCQVPFRPTASKPVFCDDCFKQDGGREGSGSRGDRSGSKDFGEITKQISLLNVKIDKLIEILTPKASAEKTKKAKTKKEVATKKKKVAPKKKK